MNGKVRRAGLARRAAFVMALMAAYMGAWSFGERGQAQADDATAGHAGPTWGEFSKLQSEVTEQRQFMIQLMQNEQQRYDMLLKLIAGGSKIPLELPTLSGPGASPNEPSVKAGVSAGLDARHRTASLDGTVSVSGGDMNGVIVYVEDIKGPLVRGKTLEIKQENKQFSPRFAVVQAGTTVTFPNLDPVFHNVFSNSQRNTFDLGTYRSGDQARSVVFSAPGVVDIFCNMHQKMSASVLVVPSRLYAKLKPDGSFHIDNVPVGARQVVAWSPSTRPVKRKVEVAPEGAKANFALEYTDFQAHGNKFGQPYGSYKD